MQWQESVSSWASLLFDASSYIEENRNLKKEILEMKANESMIVDLEEYEALKRHKSLLSSSGEYVLAKVLGNSLKGDIYLNVGVQDGIKEGDVVYLGKVFLGVVSAVDRDGSTVRLPTNRESSFEVAILNSTEQEETLLDGYVKASGVITGELDSINIENIDINSEVEDGDIVVLRDERIGEILVVGRVVGISKNPASTSKSGFVSPIFNYNNLISVFVKIN
jgi:cell shape-determining protein MreC